MYIQFALHRFENIGKGAIQVLRNAVRGERVSDLMEKRYEDVPINVISVTTGWVGVEFAVKTFM